MSPVDPFQARIFWGLMPLTAQCPGCRRVGDTDPDGGTALPWRASFPPGQGQHRAAPHTWGMLWLLCFVRKASTNTVFPIPGSSLMRLFLGTVATNVGSRLFLPGGQVKTHPLQKSWLWKALINSEILLERKSKHMAWLSRS